MVKITDAQVDEIRGQLGTMTNQQLAHRYGVVPQTISGIRTGKQRAKMCSICGRTTAYPRRVEYGGITWNVCDPCAGEMM